MAEQMLHIGENAVLQFLRFELQALAPGPAFGGCLLGQRLGQRLDWSEG